MTAALDRHVIVAVSGGADSTALLLAICEWARSASCRVTAVHFNHNLREPAVHRRELAFVRRTCLDAGVALLVGEAPAGEIRRVARRERSAIEAAARSFRYRFFSEAALASGARIVCTAHTEDDQLETIALAQKRGVDPLFSGGIPVVRELADGVLVARPLLRVSREAVLRYLNAARHSWIDDPSNRDLRYERNWIRHRLLPDLKRGDPGLRGRFLALAERSATRRDRAEAEAEALNWEVQGDRSEMDAPVFLNASRDARLLSLYREATRRGMIRASSRIPVRFFRPLLGDSIGEGTILQGRQHRIRHERGRLVWSADIVPVSEYGYLREVTLGVAVQLPTGATFVIHRAEKAITAGRASVVELKGVREPLVFRTARAGDRIATSTGKKSIRHLLSAAGVTPAERPGASVLVDPHGVLAVFDARGEIVVINRQDRPGGVLCSLEMIGVKADA